MDMHSTVNLRLVTKCSLKKIYGPYKRSSSAPSGISAWFSLPASTPVSTISIRVTQKSYKVSTSGPQTFSSHSYTSGPSAHISSSSFSPVGISSFQGGLGGVYGRASGMRGIPAVTVNQSMLSPLNLKVVPNIQALHTLEKEQTKTLNKVASVIDKVQFLEQQNKMLETKWNLLQEQKTAQSNKHNMFESSINNLRWQLETLGQQKLKLEAELGNMQGLVEDFKNKYEDEINKHTEMENEFIPIKKNVDEAYVNKVELESHLEGLTDQINFLRQLYEEEIRELQSQISDTSVVLSMDNSCSLDTESIIVEANAQYQEIANGSWAKAESMDQIKHEELQTLAGKHGGHLRSTKTELSEMNWNISQPQADTEGLKDQKASLEAAIANAEQRGELAVKEANTKVSELEAALQRVRQDVARQLCELQEPMNECRAGPGHRDRHLQEAAGGQESRLESGMQNMSIHRKTTSDYAGGLSSAYGGPTIPGLSHGLASSFGSGASSSSFSRTSSRGAWL